MYLHLHLNSADPFHFDLNGSGDLFSRNTGPDPDPASDATENRKNTKFFVLITQKMIYYYTNIENINSNEK